MGSQCGTVWYWLMIISHTERAGLGGKSVWYSVVLADDHFTQRGLG